MASVSQCNPLDLKPYQTKLILAGSCVTVALIAIVAIGLIVTGFLAHFKYIHGMSPIMGDVCIVGGFVVMGGDGAIVVAAIAIFYCKKKKVEIKDPIIRNYNEEKIQFIVHDVHTRSFSLDELDILTANPYADHFILAFQEGDIIEMAKVESLKWTFREVQEVIVKVNPANGIALTSTPDFSNMKTAFTQKGRSGNLFLFERKH